MSPKEFLAYINPQTVPLEETEYVHAALRLLLCRCVCCAVRADRHCAYAGRNPLQRARSSPKCPRFLTLVRSRVAGSPCSVCAVVVVGAARVVSLSDVLRMVDARADTNVDEVVFVLNDKAFLVQGCWVVKRCVGVKTPSAATDVAPCCCFPVDHTGTCSLARRCAAAT